jgi:hypothetical protein
MMLLKAIPKGGAVFRPATGQGEMRRIYPALSRVIMDFTRTHIYDTFGSTISGCTSRAATGTPAYLLHRHVELRHGFAFEPLQGSGRPPARNPLWGLL